MDTYKINRIVFDVDGTICESKSTDEAYFDMLPKSNTVALLRKLKASGYVIILHTARYMYTYKGDQKAAETRGRQELIDWCKKWDVPWDEIYMGKAAGDLYIDDKAVNIGDIELLNKVLFKTTPNRNYNDNTFKGFEFNG